MTLPVLPYAEVMATYSCNLSCEGCTNYADYNHTGHADWNAVKADLERWREVVRFERFGVIGGEPLLNPRLREWLYGLRETLPGTALLLVTNGVLLERFPQVMEWLFDCAPIQLTVAPHLDPAKGEAALRALVAASGQAFTEGRVDNEHPDGVVQRDVRFESEDGGVVLDVFRPRVFVRSYRGFGTSMRPWDHGDPRGAIEMCPCRYCPLLYEGRLYKCSQVALLRRQLGALGLLDCEDWQPYLAYEGVGPEDPAAVARFVRSFGKAERVCGMCPARPDEGVLVDHTAGVLTKQEWLRRHGSAWPPVAAADGAP